MTKPGRLHTGVSEVVIPLAGLAGGLPGFFGAPKAAKGVVVFAHGSGSSRFSRRNAHVAETLQEAGFATLLFDLLTEEEGEDRRNVFDIELLAQRLEIASRWLATQREARGLKVGYFGSSTGSAAALIAAAKPGADVAAVVSRGGRPDLAAEVLAEVRAPTLLIVGGHDYGVIELNESAFAKLTCVKALEIVPEATHLFEESGALDKVAALAAGWFAQHLNRQRAA
jgi:pimeloyl-ACP methyl ester carboxylesterase